MKIHNFCRHKSFGWEGVIFEDDSGKVYITNDLARLSGIPEYPGQ